ncbi:MAG: peptidylprolyl isomerase [Candidatus Thiodiazotropha sp.]
MKNKIILAALCTVGLISGCNQAAENPASKGADSARSATLPASSEQTGTAEMDANTLLTVNGQPVTRAMYALYFQDRMRGVPDAKASPEMQMGVLNELANILIVSQDAEKSGYMDHEEIAASMALLKAKLLTQALVQEYASKNKPSEEQIQKVYDDEYANLTSTEYKARHILVKEEDEAKALIADLDKGADFAELAKEHSTGPTNVKGGDLGWIDPDQMVEPFAEALKAMEKGKYSSAPVQTQFGWHVILLEDSRTNPAPTLDKVHSEIETKLQQKALTEYMQGLRDKSKLVFNENNGKPAEQTDAGAPADAADTAAPTETASDSAAAETTQEAAGEPAPASEGDKNQ